jgi:hypothetical protein
MANIFNEVDEDIRKERYQSLWNKYGKYLVGFIILIIIIFSLSQLLKSKNIRDNKEILDLYFSAAENIEKKQIELANQELEAIYIDKNKTLAAISGFRLADSFLKIDRQDKALSTLEVIFNDESLETIYRKLALYKYILINFENIQINRIKTLMQISGSSKNLLDPYFRELIGIKHLTLGDKNEASAIFTNLSSDNNIPFDLKIRLDKLIEISN